MAKPKNKITLERFKEVYKMERDFFEENYSVDIDDLESFKIIIMGLISAQKTVFNDFNNKLNALSDIIDMLAEKRG